MHNATLPEDRRAPAFSFYAQDFIVGTVTLSLAERGAYITLLAYQWDNGTVPDDATARARVLGCTKREADVVWARIVEKFTSAEDGWRNARLERERAKQAERRATLAANGQKGGRPKIQKDNQTETKRLSAEQMLDNQKQSLSLSLSSSSSSSCVLSGKAQREPDAPSEEAVNRVQAFMDDYAEKHMRVFGVGYFGSNSDYRKACELVAKFDDGDLRDATLVWFGMDDAFATQGTRTIPKFASRASDCVLRARSVA